ncbi:hypothetical protein SISNIDRAFT_485583 [Sistotremastrum niveocremeum HHB9708]|uniref:Zn(2)-C6 fungal-type domain-containing protein n=1 Tax=Sistotremastrum niveocremeum HHB9708 TaxID=1314777 RepID=A0A164UKL3_9AGAM|nr:hypothetical protein SISNIDRAFT_485583 [Sistotremastrum niveocremeum HHB9708]
MSFASGSQQTTQEEEDHSSGGLKSSTLQRGKACLSCRRRKMRCDGLKPACTQCINGKRENECHFDDGRTKSRTRILMDNIATLEQRVAELQNRQRASPPFVPSISLSTPNPYPVAGPSHASTNQIFTQPNTLGPAHLSDPTINPYANSNIPSAEYGIIPSLNIEGTNDPLWDPINAPDAIPWPTTTELGVGLGAQPVPQTLPVNALSPASFQTLINTFLAHQHQLGMSVLYDRLVRDYEETPPNQSYSPLLNAVLLWGCRFHTASPEFSRYESIFLSAALDRIAEELKHQNKAVNIVQATTLLAIYFFSGGRILEGKYHADAGSALAVALDLHQLNPEVNSTGIYTDEVLREKIFTFWNVFELGCWSLTTGSPSPLISDKNPRATVTTPWPDGPHVEPEVLKAEGGIFELGLLKSELPLGGHEGGFSMRAKVAALLQLSSRLSSSLAADKVPDAAFWDEFQSIESCVSRCFATLTSVPPRGTNLNGLSVRCSLVFVHTALLVCIILLHHALAVENADSRNKSLNAANQAVMMIGEVSDSEFEFLDPLLGVRTVDF